MFKFTPGAVALGLLLLTSCATIVSRSHTNVAIVTTPVGATVSIIDRDGAVVFNGPSPAVANLDHGAGFFRSAKYTIRIENPGYVTQDVPLKATVNGWYFGNLIFGGLIDLLIVDPLTGAMYTLPKTPVQIALTQTSTFLPPADGQLRVLNLDQVPAELRGSLVQVSK